MKKKLICLMIALCLVVLLAGCGGTSGSSGSGTGKEPAEAEAGGKEEPAAAEAEEETGGKEEPAAAEAEAETAGKDEQAEKPASDQTETDAVSAEPQSAEDSADAAAADTDEGIGESEDAAAADTDGEIGEAEDAVAGGTDEGAGEAEDAAAAGNDEEPVKADERASLLYMGHSSIRISTPEDKVIYIDPFAGEGYEPAADLILVTHGHYDHYNLEKVENTNPDCRTITWEDALANGEYHSFDLGFANVESVEAGNNQYHNINECVGYIVTLSDGISVYVSGDTSTTEQMSSLAEKEIDYAFFCCDGIYNMDMEEAAECASMIKAKHNIPYHIVPAGRGSIFDRERAEQFEAPDRLILEDGQEIELE